MKRIKEAAILFTDGKVYTGKRHHDVIATIIKETGAKHVGAGSVQGFITIDGEFVDREVAARLALECGQITELKYNSRELFSEDLY